MKKLNYFFLLCAVCLMTVACVKENESEVDSRSYDKFIIESPNFTSDSKSYLDFTAALSRILYENGDVLYVNGRPFTLVRDGDHWIASGDDTVRDRGGEFYCCHADGDVSSFSAPSYNVSFNSNLTTTSGIVLAGTTTPHTNVITLTPSFAVLVFTSADIADYIGIKVGFENGKVPYVFNVSASSGSMSNVSYLPQANSSNINYTMLTMNKVSNYYYVAVPINGSSVTTKLYFLFSKSGVGDIQRVTANQVTLTKGKVYIIPSEDMSDYPFDQNGAGKGVFSVSSTQTVRFSAGNLQCIPFPSMRKWQFAPHQYSIISQNDNQQIAISFRNFIDLLGYGTTGRRPVNTYNSYQPYSTGTDSLDYAYNDLTGSFREADWGSRTILYGNNESELTWRTLSNEEWTYLLNTRPNAANRKAIATVNGVKGLVLLPDTWTIPSGLRINCSSLNRNWSTNTYDGQDWSKMESAGAIFLPVSGYRLETTVIENSDAGYYWSSTIVPGDNNTGLSYALHFSSNVKNLLSVGRERGCSVRLVTNAN